MSESAQNSESDHRYQTRRKNSYGVVGRVKAESPILRRVNFRDGYTCDVRGLQKSRDVRFFARKTLERDYSR